MSDHDDIDPRNMDNIIRLSELTSKQTVVVTEDAAALLFAERYQGELLFDHDVEA
jgi:hypothetical protein